MQAHFRRGETPLPSCPVEELQAQLASGRVQAGDLVWHAGLKQWHPLAILLTPQPARLPARFPTEPPPVSVVAPLHSRNLSIEHKHRPYEVNFCALGIVCFFASAACLVRALIFVLAERGHHAVLAAGLLILAGYLMWLGRKMRALRESTRTPATIVATLGLVFPPWGTLAGSLMLWLLWNRRSRFIFEPAYGQLPVEARRPQYHMARQERRATQVLTAIRIIIMLSILFLVLSF